MSFEEQITSEDKYPSIFKSQWRQLCLLSFKYFFETRAVLKTGDSEYHSEIPSFSWGMFSHVMCANKNSAHELAEISITLLP